MEAGSDLVSQIGQVGGSSWGEGLAALATVEVGGDWQEDA